MVSELDCLLQMLDLSGWTHLSTNTGSMIEVESLIVMPSSGGFAGCYLP